MGDPECIDIDGVANVVVVTVAWCADCGREVEPTETGWHHVDTRTAEA